MNNPRCFISYSWDSPLHKDWVRSLAEQLHSNGVYTVLDQWDVQLGDQLPKYMESSIRESDFVLLICTPIFASKANAGKGGVGYEKSIVTGEIFTDCAPDRKYVALLRQGNPEESLPSYLKSKAYIDFRSDSKFEENLKELLRHFFEKPRYNRPPLGDKPQFNFMDPQTPKSGRTLSEALIRELQARPVQEQERVWGYNGTSRKRIVYVDCDDRVWVSARRQLKSIGARKELLAIPYGNSLRVLGDDQEGRFWAIIDFKLHFLIQRSAWKGLTIPELLLPRSVTIWHDPPNGIAGPIGPVSGGAAILTSTDWKWRYTSTLDLEVTCAAASGSSVWVAGPQGCAASTYPELKWSRIYQFPSSLVRPASVLVSQAEAGLWLHSGDHMLWWLDLAVREPKPKQVTTADGLPGNRVDLVAIQQNGQLWCATSGGVAVLEHSKSSHFVTVSHDRPNRLWVDATDRTWYLAGQKVWCWFSKE